MNAQPPPEEKPRLGIIGAGRVGATLARLLHASGYKIVGIHSRTALHAVELAQLVGTAAFTSPGAVVARSDLTLLTVPDDAITTVAERIQGNIRGKYVIHTSGAHDVTALEALTERGVIAGSLHPAFPFASVAVAMHTLQGATFALEAEDARLAFWLREIVRALQGYVMAIPPGGKAAYHAALVIASNYAVVLYAVAHSILTGLDANPAIAANALNVLLDGTMDNLRHKGLPDALTGPLARGDLGTIAAHLRALRARDPKLVEMYTTLARLAYPVLEARGIPTESIEKVIATAGEQPCE